MIVLITGGCGFIGSNLAVALRTAGHTVCCFDNLSRRGTEWLRDRILLHGCDFVHGDVRNSEDFDKVKMECEVLIECSAEPSVLMGTRGADARYVLNVNLTGAINCFEWARAREIPVLFLSSSRVYPYDRINTCRFVEQGTRYELAAGVPGVTPEGVCVDMPLGGTRSLYGATKLCAELILQEYSAQYGLPTLINRCGVVAGPWQLGKADQGVFTFWLASHYFNRPLKYIGFGGQGKQVRDLLHVDDLTDLVLQQLAKLSADRNAWHGAVYNVGGARHAHLSLRETTELCAHLTGRSMVIGCEPSNRPADVIWYITDIGETKKTFEWMPKRNAATIMRDIFQWLAQHEEPCKRILIG